MYFQFCFIETIQYCMFCYHQRIDIETSNKLQATNQIKICTAKIQMRITYRSFNTY